VRGRGSRILIADEVGLGKTIQAALIVAELQSRGAASRVLVITPAGLREQWADELASRFNLQLTLFDTKTVARRRASLPIGVNPWSVEPFIVASIDYIKRPEVLPAVQSCRWDVVIVDEAHHVALGTDRRDAVDGLCRMAPYVLLLTATPHNGDARAFASLCDIGRHDERLLVFRRTRQQIGQSYDRRVHQLRVRPTPEERHMHASVDAFVRAVQSEPAGRTAETWLALSTLRKRALSSAFALERSVQSRLRHLSSSTEDDQYQLGLPLTDAAGEFDATDDLPPWAIPALRDSRRERFLLARVERAASRVAGHESKLDALSRILRRIAEPAMIFTEYRDTLMHIRDRIVPDATLLHGGLSRDERRLALARFQRGGLLLATDAASEGLNLHHTCRIVINLELPWNPMRLEQRIGRVDRIGQRRRVHAFHLIAAGTMEMRILQRLATRVATAQADVGAPNPLRSTDSESRVYATNITTEHLEAEATTEHERLMLARRLTATPATSDNIADGNQGLVLFSRRRTVRSHLKSRVLVVFRSVLWNDAGQNSASHLTPVLVHLRARDRSCLKDLEALDAVLMLDANYSEWLATSLTTHGDFWNTRLRREIAIANIREQTTAGELQPGLFDMRAERAWLDEDERIREAIRDRMWHTNAAKRAACVTPNGPRVALVLAP
jgi:SNF2 family DNA or RNA helicase